MGILVNYQVMNISENSKKFRIKKILDFADKSNNFTNIMKTIYLKPSIEKLTTSVHFLKGQDHTAKFILENLQKVNAQVNIILWVLSLRCLFHESFYGKMASKTYSKILIFENAFQRFRFLNQKTDINIQNLHWKSQHFTMYNFLLVNLWFLLHFCTESSLIVMFPSKSTEFRYNSEMRSNMWCVVRFGTICTI